MGITGKAMRYITLTDAEANGRKLSTAEAKEVHSLRRELSARGLDPQHTTGLEYRALVFDHKKKVENFVKLHENDKRKRNLEQQLKNLGITPDPQRLERILSGFKVNAKAVDKLKRTQGVCMSRQHADAKVAEVTTEIDIEQAELAAEELAAAETARVQRQRESEASITAFVAEAMGISV